MSGLPTHHARRLDERGRCCGRKPIPYKRPPHLFCTRCDADYDPATGEQIPNWAWKRAGAGFVATYPESADAQNAAHALIAPPATAIAGHGVQTAQPKTQAGVP